MSWAGRRRAVVLIVGVAVLATIVSIGAISSLYQAPSCVDRIQNGDEAGVDCGGSCPYLCTSQVAAPTVLYTKAVDNGAGRIDIVAAVENTNATAAAKDVPYRIRLYANDGHVLREAIGTVDLPPASTGIVFRPGIAFVQESFATAFLEIDPSAPHWYTASDLRTIPSVSDTLLGGTTAHPRITAVLTNPVAQELSNIPVVCVVKDRTGTVIGASSTVVPTLTAQGQATAIFTWNGPFAGTPTTIQIVPMIPLPPR